MDISRYKTVVIAKDGSGDFSSLSAAAALQDKAAPVRFYLKNGVYHERPFLELDDYLLEGESQNGVVIRAAVGALTPWPGEMKTGTFRSWTLFLGGKRAALKRLTVENAAGDGAVAGQGIAVYADAEKVFMEDVSLRGNQDTLFTAPLPQKEREPNGFRGPRESFPRRPSLQFYHGCTISGNIDFIFGGADAIFYQCDLVPVPHSRCVSYIAAPSTPQGGEGYLFARCRVGGQGRCSPGTVYLGRPWRPYAKAFYLDCLLGPEVSPAGWDNWHEPQNERTTVFGEAGSIGPGAVYPRAFGTVDIPKAASHQRARLAARLAEYGIADRTF